MYAKLAGSCVYPSTYMFKYTIAVLFVIYLCIKNVVFYRQSENFIQFYTLVISAVSYKLVIYHEYCYIVVYCFILFYIEYGL